MDTQPQITCQGFSAPPHVLDRAAAEIGKLEKLFGQITACRVVIRRVSERRHKGTLHEVSVHLALPGGREVAVSRGHAAARAQADVMIAIRDAFRAARRQLLEEARGLRGDLKHRRAAAALRIKAGAADRQSITRQPAADESRRGFGAIESL